MQGRMKQHQLTVEQIERLLSNGEVGRMATLNEDGYPYIVPVHFVVEGGKIYIHGLNRGEKISNLMSNDKVGFEVDKMMGLLLSDNEDPCDTNTEYESVVVVGTAKMVEDDELKKVVLRGVVAKYTPELSHLDFPEKMMRATGVIEITPIKITGKYYK